MTRSPTKGAHLCCFLAGDADVTTSVEACKGIGCEDFGWVHAMLKKGNPAPGSAAKRPQFKDLVELVFSPHKSRPTFSEFGPSSKSKTLKLALACLLAEGAEASDGSSSVVVCDALVRTIKVG